MCGFNVLNFSSVLLNDLIPLLFVVMIDSSLKPAPCLLHGLASLGEQSQAVCSTKLHDSVVGDTNTSSLQQIRQEKTPKMLFSPQPRVYPTATKSGASQGTSGVQKRTPQAHLPPERVFECLDMGSRGKGTVKELELLQDSDDDDSDSEGRRLSIAGLDKLFFIIFVIMYGSCCFLCFICSFEMLSSHFFWSSLSD